MKGMKSFEFRVWARCYVKYKGDFIKLNQVRNKIRIRKLGTTMLDYKSKGLNIQGTHLLHTSSITYQDKKLSIFLDNSIKKSIINRKNGIYKVYDNLFLNDGSVPNDYDPNYKMIDKFTFNLTEILEDLYDNNVSTVFNLYFIIKPDFNKTIKFDIVKLNQHFAKYPLEFIDQNLIKFYKNTGLLTAFGILVFAPCYDINNLIAISSERKNQIIENIKIINSLVDKDFNNTIINFENKIDKDSEIMLIIHAEFDKIKPIFGYN
jgi:hypothetical protein